MSISGKLVAWIIGLSVATHLGLEHYRNKTGAPANRRMA